MWKPTNDEQRLMIIGGFDKLEDYLEWLHSPTDPAILEQLEEHDYEEDVIDEMIEAGEWPTDEDDPETDEEYEARLDEEEAEDIAQLEADKGPLC